MRLLNTESTYKLLQPFATIEQLNENTKAIRNQFAKVLSLAARQVLDVLHRYAAKFYGVCYLSKSKIAEMLGVTKRTVIRVCQRLESLGIIAQYKLYRHNGDKRQSSNAIVFLTQIEARDAFVEVIDNVSDNIRVQADVTPGCHSEEALLEAQKNNKYINNNTYPQAEESASLINLEIDKKDQTPYQKLKSFVKLFVTDNKLAYKLYGIWLAQTKTIATKPDFEIALKAARYTMNAIKSKNVKSVTGYFNGVLNNLINKWLEEVNQMYAQDWTLSLDTDYEPYEVAYVAEGSVIDREELTPEDIALNEWLDSIGIK